MPWATPTLRRVREMVRDDIASTLSGAVLIGNNVLRVMSDAMAGLGHLTLRYIDWLALQLIPDTAEHEWLDRHGQIWLRNADGSLGRKPATYAEGRAVFTGRDGGVIPEGAVLSGPNTVTFETLEEVLFSTDETSVEVRIRALDAGVIGNLLVDTPILLVSDLTRVDSGGTISIATSGGTEQETDEQLRARVLLRIRNPPMGGDATDYVQWALAMRGVTRAWAAPLEMGFGTVTVRFMMDDFRANNDGFPLTIDVMAMREYLDTIRPVAVKDFFVESPVPEPIDFTIDNLDEDTASVRAAIALSVADMLQVRASPAYSFDGVLQPATTIYAAWVSEAILQTSGVSNFTLTMDDHPMPNNGRLAVLGTITYL